MRALKIGFVPYSPLGRGMLTGRLKDMGSLPEDDWRRRAPRFQGGNFAQNLALVERLEAIAGEKGCTPGQLALAWVLAQGQDIVPIPGTKRRSYLEENVAALQVKLTTDDLARIQQALPVSAVAGQRYAEAGMRTVGR